MIMVSIFIGNGAGAEDFAYPLYKFPVTKEVLWSPDGMRVAVISNKSDVAIWNHEYNTTVSLGKSKKEIVTAAWSPDGRYLATGTVGGTIIIWDSVLGEESFRVIVQVDKPIKKIIWSPDSKKIMSIIENAAPRLWAMDKSGRLNLGDSNPQHITGTPQASWSPDSIYIAAAGLEGVRFISLYSVTIFNVSTGQLSKSLKAEHTNAPIGLVAWTPQGDYIAVGYLDNTVIIWDAVAGKSKFIIENTSKLNCFAWSPDGLKLALGLADHIALLDLLEKKALRFRINKNFKSLAWNSSSSNILATAAEDTKAYIYNLDGKITYVLPHKRAVESAAWNQKDETRVLTATKNSRYMWGLTDIPMTPAMRPALDFLVGLRFLPLEQQKDALEKSSYFFSIEALHSLTHLIIIEEQGLIGTGPWLAVKIPMLTLNLRNLHINDLTGLDAIVGKKNIHTVDLRDNALEAVPNNAFAGFDSLRYILLDNNKIQSLSADSFKNIPHLQWINIANNQLSPEVIQKFKDDMKLIAPKAIIISKPLGQNQEDESVQ